MCRKQINKSLYSIVCVQTSDQTSDPTLSISGFYSKHDIDKTTQIYLFPGFAQGKTKSRRCRKINYELKLPTPVASVFNVPFYAVKVCTGCSKIIRLYCQSSHIFKRSCSYFISYTIYRMPCIASTPRTYIGNACNLNLETEKGLQALGAGLRYTNFLKGHIMETV